MSIEQNLSWMKRNRVHHTSPPGMYDGIDLSNALSTISDETAQADCESIDELKSFRGLVVFFGVDSWRMMKRHMPQSHFESACVLYEPEMKKYAGWLRVVDLTVVEPTRLLGVFAGRTDMIKIEETLRGFGNDFLKIASTTSSTIDIKKKMAFDDAIHEMMLKRLMEFELEIKSLFEIYAAESNVSDLSDGDLSLKAVVRNIAKQISEGRAISRAERCFYAAIETVRTMTREELRYE